MPRRGYHSKKWHNRGKSGRKPVKWQQKRRSGSGFLTPELPPLSPKEKLAGMLSRAIRERMRYLEEKAVLQGVQEELEHVDAKTAREILESGGNIPNWLIEAVQKRLQK